MLRSLVLLILLVLSAPAHAATLTGRVLNGSQPGGFVPDLSVRLTADLAGEADRLDTSVDTDAEGRFRFTDLPGDTADVYVLSANFQGVIYPSRFLKFELGAETLESELLVFEVTDDVNVLLLEGHHYIFEIHAGGGSVHVTEVFGIANPTQETFLTHTPLELPLPHGAHSVEILQGLEEGFIADGGIRYAGPIRPGHHEGAVRYSLPMSTPFRFTGEEVLPVDLVTALVAPMGTKVTGAGITHMEAVDLGGGLVCDRYQIPVNGPGQPFSLTLSVVGPSSSVAWFVVGGLLVLAVAVTDWRRRRDRPGAHGPEVDALVHKRDRLLTEILALEASGLSDADTGAERGRLLDKATALQELIDERSGSTT